MIYIVLQKDLNTGHTSVAGAYDSEALAEREMAAMPTDDYAYEIDFAFLEKDWN